MAGGLCKALLPYPAEGERQPPLLSQSDDHNKGLAVTSRRLLCALVRPPGSCSCWAWMRPARRHHGEHAQELVWH